MREPAVLAETAPRRRTWTGAIVGSCPAMREVYKAIGRVAAQNVPVLITGEKRHGKNVGRSPAIYQHGPRAKAPFLALNCAGHPGRTCSRASCSGHERRLH